MITVTLRIVQTDPEDLAIKHRALAQFAVSHRIGIKYAGHKMLKDTAVHEYIAVLDSVFIVNALIDWALAREISGSFQF